MLWLDFKLFGNGHGMKSPYCDDTFYWLSGKFYRWIGGFGAQIQSFEWFAPKAGTRRCLFGNEFVVFSVSRKFLRVETSWALSSGMPNIEQIRRLKESLQREA